MSEPVAKSALENIENLEKTLQGKSHQNQIKKIINRRVVYQS